MADLLGALGAIAKNGPLKPKLAEEDEERLPALIVAVESPAPEEAEARAEQRQEAMIARGDEPTARAAAAGRAQVNPELTAQQRFLSGLTDEQREIVRKFQTLQGKD